MPKFITTEALLDILKRHIAHAKDYSTEAKELYYQCYHSDSPDSIESIKKMNIALAYLNQAHTNICCLLSEVDQIPESIEVDFVPEIIQKFEHFNDTFLSSYRNNHSIDECIAAYDDFAKKCAHFFAIYFPV